MARVKIEPSIGAYYYTMLLKRGIDDAAVYAMAERQTNRLAESINAHLRAHRRLSNPSASDEYFLLINATMVPVDFLDDARERFEAREAHHAEETEVT